MFKVTDDSGFLAVIVPGAYKSFVDTDWELAQLFNHFLKQMARHSLLIWGTGLEGYWSVDVRACKSTCAGFREISGPLQVAGGLILVTNYESLTMAAQFDEVHLPEKHQESNLIELQNGAYCCRVMQMFDPQEKESADDGEADFIIEIFRSETLLQSWGTVPWFSDENFSAD